MPKMLVMATALVSQGPDHPLIQGEALQFGDADLYEGEITDELPAEALGEILSEAAHMLWKQGNDPTKVLFTVQFE